MKKITKNSRAAKQSKGNRLDLDVIAMALCETRERLGFEFLAEVFGVSVKEARRRVEAWERANDDAAFVYVLEIGEKLIAEQCDVTVDEMNRLIDAGLDGVTFSAVGAEQVANLS